MHFGATLRRLRLESGVSLRGLARRLGVSSAYLSRVEHGLDGTPTAERLEAIAVELGLPAGLLLEVGDRLSPFVKHYVEHEPQASALFLDIARHGLDAAELAEVQDFVARRFGPVGGAAKSASRDHRLAPLLEVDRIVVGVHCTALDDAIEVGCMRLTARGGAPDAATLARAFVERSDVAGASVGGGVAVVSTTAAETPTAALLLLDPPLPDGERAMPLSILVLLAGPAAGHESLIRIAHVARLAARGLADAVRGMQDPDAVLRRLALLEGAG